MTGRRHPDQALRSIRAVHPHAWLWEGLDADPSFVLRSMFGARMLYLHGLMMLGFCDGQEPWRGVLVCTDQARHSALLGEFPSLHPHPVLGKWLYLQEASGDFERCAAQLVRLARARDPRLGVVPGVRRRRLKTTAKAQKRSPARGTSRP